MTAPTITVAAAPAPSQVRPPRGELAALDAMRALAALAVVVVHVAQAFALAGVDMSWGRAGDAGVHVFFVISGYLITASALRPGAGDTRTFLLRRAARLLPLYYLCLLVYLAFVDPGPLLSGPGRVDLGWHLVMLHGLFEDYRHSINGVLWTLTIESMFYVQVAVLAPVLRRSSGTWIVATAMVATGLVWRFVVFQADLERTESAYLIQQLPGMADLFGAGMLLAAAERAGWFRRLAASAASRSALFVVSSVVVVAALAAYHQRKAGFWQSQVMVVGWPLALAAGVAGLVAVAATRWAPAERVARGSGLAFLGRVSYGIYLFHPFVIAALLRSWTQRSEPLEVAPFLAIVLVLTVLVAVAAHHGLERPAMEWARRRSRSPSSVGQPAVGPEPLPSGPEQPLRPGVEALDGRANRRANRLNFRSDQPRGPR